MWCHYLPRYTEGEGLVHYHVCDVIIYLGIQRGKAKVLRLLLRWFWGPNCQHCKKYLVKMTTSAWLLNKSIVWLKKTITPNSGQMRPWNFLSLTPNSGQMRSLFTSATYRDRCGFLNLGLVITLTGSQSKHNKLRWPVGTSPQNRVRSLPIDRSWPKCSLYPKRY